MADLEWHEALRKLLDAGGGEAAGDRRFLPLATLESGARCGLDRDRAWILAPGDGRAPFAYTEADAYLWHEVLEWKRDRFESEIGVAARSHGLSHDDVVFSFPAVGVVRAVLAKRVGYLTLLALKWLLPSELRELRREIGEVLKAPNIPVPVKELAARLIVPE